MKKIIFIIPLLFILSCDSTGRKGEITKRIKSVMNDPGSFKLRSFENSVTTNCNDTYLVSFTGKNAFGGTVQNTYYVIYKNDTYCQMGDWGGGGSEMGVSNNKMMEMMITINGCSC